MAFATYYETGSIRDGTLVPHTKIFASRRAALAHACELSQGEAWGGYVTVSSKGIEVAAFYKGRRVVDETKRRRR